MKRVIFSWLFQGAIFTLFSQGFVFMACEINGYDFYKSVFMMHQLNDSKLAHRKLNLA